MRKPWVVRIRDELASGGRPGAGQAHARSSKGITSATLGSSAGSEVQDVDGSVATAMQVATVQPRELQPVKAAENDVVVQRSSINPTVAGPAGAGGVAATAGVHRMDRRGVVGRVEIDLT